MKERVKALWLAEAIQLTEQHSGRFADQHANRVAQSCDGDVTDKLLCRANILAQQHGLAQSQTQYLQASKLALILLFILAIFIGGGLSLTALAQQPINLFWALLAILGLHLLSLVIWLFSFCFLPQESGSLFIQLWLWLSRHVIKQPAQQQLLPAFISLFGTRIRWLFGLLVNLFWSVILTAALIALLFLFATKHYSFVWQTTLLSSETLVQLVNRLGYLPHLLGFAIPSQSVIEQSGDLALNAADIRATWASWFIGVIVVFGCLLRLGLTLLCWILWRRAERRVTLDLNRPQTQLIIQKITAPLSQIVDQEQSVPAATYPINPTDSAVDYGIVAIDLPDDWQPPPNMPFYGWLNNRQQRRQLLAHLQLQPAKQLLIAVDSDRVPDRGMINLIQELRANANQCAIWLLNEGKQLRNWQQQLAQLQLSTQTPAWLDKEQ